MHFSGLCVRRAHRYLSAEAHLARTEGVPRPIPGLDIHEGQVSLLRELDLTSPETAEKVGISEEELIADDQSRCREKGEEAYYAKYEAALSRSAAQERTPFEERDRTLVVISPSVRNAEPMWSPPAFRCGVPSASPVQVQVRGGRQ